MVAAAEGFSCCRSPADSAARALDPARASPSKAPPHSQRDDCHAVSKGRFGFTFPTIPVVPQYGRPAPTVAINVAAVGKVCVNGIIVQCGPESLGVLPVPNAAIGKLAAKITSGETGVMRIDSENGFRLSETPSVRGSFP